MARIRITTVAATALISVMVLGATAPAASAAGPSKAPTRAILKAIL